MALCGRIDPAHGFTDRRTTHTNAHRRVLSRDWGVGDGNAGAVAARETDRRYAVAMWAFALEENGDYARAAAVARGVLAEDPTGSCGCCRHSFH